MNIKYIDLFAGIGGFRLACDKAGFNCVYSNDYNKFSCETYRANFGEIELADISSIDSKTIPNFDMLCGGFPCQPFSIAGVVKKQSLGRAHGFEDKEQGNLFFEILRIVNTRQPKIIFLENVKNLRSHDKGKTWQVIQSSLEKIGYTVFSDVLDAKYYVPQRRQRIFIICFKTETFPEIEFLFPKYPKKRKYELKEMLISRVADKYTLSDKLWRYLQQHKKNSQAKGNGFGYGLFNRQSEYTRTISARYYKDGSEVLIEQRNKNPRRLTPRECARLQGFQENFEIPVSDNQAYKQFGNSVAVPVVESIAKQIKKTLVNYEKGGARKAQTELFAARA